jgi:hypothetical protein
MTWSKDSGFRFLWFPRALIFCEDERGPGTRMVRKVYRGSPDRDFDRNVKWLRQHMLVDVDKERYVRQKVKEIKISGSWSQAPENVPLSTRVQTPYGQL